MKKQYFTSGEFADLCNTTKETLRHYNYIDLLKPEKLAPNGYQYYSDLQISDFYLIATLKNTGCSLEKIRRYFSTPDQAGFQSILKEQLNALIKDKQKLIRKEKLLRHSIEKFELLQDGSKLGICHIEECEKEYYIATPVKSNIILSGAWAEAMKEHIYYCREHDFGEEYQLSYLMMHENFMNGDYYNGISICSRIASRKVSERLHIKPKSRYIKLVNQWNPNSYNIPYNTIKAYAKNNGFEICGNAYESEISLYMQTNEESYFTEISVQIK